MKNKERNTITFLIGFFICSYPVAYVFNGSLIDGLLTSIFGLSFGIYIYLWSKE